MSVELDIRPLLVAIAIINIIWVMQQKNIDEQQLITLYIVVDDDQTLVISNEPLQHGGDMWETNTMEEVEDYMLGLVPLIVFDGLTCVADGQRTLKLAVTVKEKGND